MNAADQLIGLATKAGLPDAFPASICGNPLPNMNGCNCRMPSRSQITPSPSWSFLRGSSTAGWARAPASGRVTAPPTARLSLMSWVLFPLPN